MKLIFEKLWIVLDNENLFETSKNLWKNKIPFRYKKGLEKIAPDYFYIQENKPIIFFFRRTLKEETFTQIWNLWWIPLIYVETEWNLDIYNGFDFDTKNKVFQKIENNNISILHLISWKEIESFGKKIHPVDKELLENLTSASKTLIGEWLNKKYAQNLIWRLLFSRFLIDNEISIDSHYFSDRNSFLWLIVDKSRLYKYFQYLKTTFNGDLFPIGENEANDIHEKHLRTLQELFSWSKINWNSIQGSLFDVYDFKIIPVELISEVYEQFMWEEKQRKDWAYYTPSFLADYILEKTVKKHLETHNECKIFDPSCGSGIFLVESFRMIVEKNRDENGMIEIEKLTNLLTHNIFWLDKNEIAVNLSIFSLYLILLDYVNPKDINKFKFPNIKNSNLFVWDFFDWGNRFNIEIKNIDFVVGNPPWGSDKEKDNIHIQFIKKFEKAIGRKIISDKQIAQSFILRLQDFITEHTRISLVLPSSILYNHNALNFRQYFLNNFKLSEVLELSPVRNQLFSRATAPTFIAFFERSSTDTKKSNVIIHTSIKPNIFLKYFWILVIEKNDIKKIEQKYFSEYDYLWKIMLYGNVFDFYFIKRLKEDFNDINTIIDSNNFFFGQGIQIWWWDKNNATHLVWKSFLDTWGSKKALSNFFINDKILEKFNKTYLHRIRNEKLFKKWPKVLIKKWFNKKNFSNISAYTENEYIFTDSITAIVWENKNILKNIVWILNSGFFSYFFLLQGSSSGIEREQWHNEDDRFMAPVCINDKISILVDQIQESYTILNNQTLHDPKLKHEIDLLEKKLNEVIFTSFDISKQERTLIDYTKEVVIPLINNDKKNFNKTNPEQLREYAQIFMDEFWETWNGNKGKYFEIDIYSNDYVVWINFKVSKEGREDKIQFIDNKEKTEEVFELLKIGEEKITKSLYKMRDVRWFNENSFYIVKFNQAKNWHKAMAYVDVAEFRDAMMKSWLKKLRHNHN